MISLWSARAQALARGGVGDEGVGTHGEAAYGFGVGGCARG